MQRVSKRSKSCSNNSKWVNFLRVRINVNTFPAGHVPGKEKPKKAQVDPNAPEEESDGENNDGEQMDHS